MDKGENFLNERRESHAGGLSQKRCRSSLSVAYEADNIVPEEGLPVKKTGCTGTRQRAVNGEKLEKMANRNSRVQGSKRREKKGCQQSVLTSSACLKGRSTNSQSRTCTTSILDLYGLKAKPVDLTRHMIDVTLDQLLLGTYNSSIVSNRDTAGSDGNLERLITKILNIFSKSCATPAPLCSSGTDSGFALNLEGKLTLDLEHSLQPKEQVPAKTPESKASKELSTKDVSLLPVTKESEIDLSLNGENNLLILDASAKFSVDNLPDYPVEDFLSRLKLPSIGSLDLLVSNSKLAGAAEVAESLRKSVPTCIPSHSLPPLPHSVPVVGTVKPHADYDCNEKSRKVFERQWFRGGTNEIDANGFQALLKAVENGRECMEFFTAIENLRCKNVNGRLGTKFVARKQVNLHARIGVNDSIHTVSNLQSELFYSKVDCSGDHISGKPSLDLELNKESESSEIKSKTSFNEVVQDLLPFKSFHGKNSVESQIQAPLSGMQFKVSKDGHQDGMQLVEECALKQASLLAVRSSNLESFQVNCRPGFASPIQSSSYFPVVPYSPGAMDAAQILCSMANFMSCGLERGQVDKGKRKTPRIFQPSTTGFTKNASKLARADSKTDKSSVSLRSKSEEICLNIAADDSTTSKKLSSFEIRKSISGLNQVRAAVERISGSPSSCHTVETSNLPGGYVLLLAAQTGNPANKTEGERHTEDALKTVDGEGCPVPLKTLSGTYHHGRSTKGSFPLKLRTFTGGPPKQTRVMPTNFPKASGGSRDLAESSLSSQKIDPISLNPILRSFSVPVNTWRKNHSMEKQDASLRHDARFAKSSGK